MLQAGLDHVGSNNGSQEQYHTVRFLLRVADLVRLFQTAVFCVLNEILQPPNYRHICGWVRS